MSPFHTHVLKALDIPEESDTSESVSDMVMYYIVAADEADARNFAMSYGKLGAQVHDVLWPRIEEAYDLATGG